jgi:hypothetical protein
MNHREHAAAVATRFEGRCTCATMDGGVDCPWCQVFHDVLRGHPLVPPPAHRRLPSLSALGPAEA